MPNVNYRGNPSQDPNAPPESGMTSIPLGAPWPPLSREQVVELHEGLVAFRGEMEASKGIRSHEDQQDMIWGAAVELDGLLVELGIGSPPPTRTWTHEEVAKVAEEVQQRSGLPRHTEGRAPTTATELAILESMGWKSPADEPRRQEGQWEEPPKRNCWTCKHAGFKSSRYGYKYATCGSPVGGASYWVTKQILDGEEMPPKDSDGCPGWEPKS